MVADLLARIASAFAEARIPYIVIGGQAVLLYGEPRLTQDADILIGMAPEKFAGVEKIVRNLGFEVPLENPGEFVRENMVLPAVNRETGLRLEMIFSSAPFEQQAISNAEVVMLEDVPVSFASLDDLIIYKIVAGRPRDIEDVKNIITRNHALVRAHHIRKWLALFDSQTGEGFVEVFDGLYRE